MKPEGFYVDIRKDNSLNIYYNGGSLLKITLSHSEINCKIHKKYLSKEESKEGSKYVIYDPIHLPEEADKIKENIASYYSNTSEYGIKARLIRNPNARYIDSEFAHIDLTKLENNKIVFVELKRIQDHRLLPNKYNNGEPEILSQMKAYHQFINDHKQEITKYYKKLFMIKRDLGILPKSLNEIKSIENYELCDNVELYIEPYSEPYSELSPKNIQKINVIKTILDKNKISHNL
jgi:hypothetical protein